jgi:diaminohydroxyphosphoribosylaminopyrimidine deaminase/5-amino-6-(5-phosphoribosylamino)uracil reductase
MPLTAKIHQLPGECIVYTSKTVDKPAHVSYTIEQTELQDGHIDLHAVLTDLAEKQVNLLHVEAGSVLCGALLKNDLVDEIIVYMAPHIMGNSAKGLFHLPGLDKMHQRINLEMVDFRKIGNDMRLTLVPV